MTLYEKRGRRYFPISEYSSEFVDSFPKGAHLVICEPGSRLTRYNVDPDYAAVLAAAEPLRRQICDIVTNGLAMRPSRRLVTDKQHEAYKAFVEAMGCDGYCVEYASAGEIADAVANLVCGVKM